MYSPLLLIFFWLSTGLLQAQQSASQSSAQSVRNYGQLPLRFEFNEGQTDARAKFLSRGEGYTLFLTGNEAVLKLAPASQSTLAVLRTRLVNASGEAPVTGEGRLITKSNYFLGNNPARWHVNVPNFLRVHYREVYPGVDLVYYGNNGRLEYDFRVAPHANPAAIKMQVDGANALTLARGGDLTMKLADGKLYSRRPVLYQIVNGKRKKIAGSYLLRGNNVSFHVGSYDRSKELIIDPVLVYSTYLGGHGFGDAGHAIAADSQGNAYVAGITSATDFPTTTGAFQTSSPGSGFVSKLNADGTQLIYSTYFPSGISSIALDSSGDVYITGSAGAGFPTTPGAFQSSPVASPSAYVAKLDASGSQLLYSTYVSGSTDSTPNGIAIDSAGNAYVAGITSTGFPTTSGAYQTAAGTDRCRIEFLADGPDAFVFKLNQTGSALVYSTYLGHGCDFAHAIAVNDAGEAFVTGHTQDANFPVTDKAFQTTFSGLLDTYLTKLNADGSGLIYSTFIAGSGIGDGLGIAVDKTDAAYVAGQNQGHNFPVTPAAFQTTSSNKVEGYVARLSPKGNSLEYSTFINGSDQTTLHGIAVDKNRRAYVTGFTHAADYPTTPDAVQRNCFQNSNATGCLENAVVSVLDGDGANLLYSSYFGASTPGFPFGGNRGAAVAVDSQGSFYITGETGPGLLTTPGTVQPAFPGNPGFRTGFAAKFSPVLTQ